MKKIKKFLVVFEVMCIILASVGCGKSTKKNSINVEEMVAQAEQYWKECKFKEAKQIFDELIDKEMVFKTALLTDAQQSSFEKQKGWINDKYAEKCISYNICERAIKNLKSNLKNPNSLEVERIEFYVDGIGHNDIDIENRSFKVIITYRATNTFGGIVPGEWKDSTYVTKEELAIINSMSEFEGYDVKTIQGMILYRTYVSNDWGVYFEPLLKGDCTWDYSLIDF